MVGQYGFHFVSAHWNGNLEFTLGIGGDDFSLTVGAYHTVYIELHALHGNRTALITDGSAHGERRFVHEAHIVVHARRAQRHLLFGGGELVRAQTRNDFIQRSVADIRHTGQIV